MAKTEKVKIGVFEMAVQGATADYLDKLNKNGRTFSPEDVRGDGGIAVDEFVQAMFLADGNREKSKRLSQLVGLSNQLDQILRRYLPVALNVRELEARNEMPDQGMMNRAIQIGNEYNQMMGGIDDLMGHFPEPNLVQSYSPAQDCPSDKKCLRNWMYDKASPSPYRPVLDKFSDQIFQAGAFYLGLAMYFDF